MLRQRDAHDVRRDALQMALRKLTEGCTSCADKYFQVARANGATEEEIARAVADAKVSPAPGVSRRSFVQGVAGATAALAAGALLEPVVRASAGAQPAAAEAVAWVSGVTRGVPVAKALGISSSGFLVGEIEIPAEGVIRSADHRKLYGLFSRRENGTSQPVIEEFDAADASHQRTIVGQPVATAGPNDWEGVRAFLSPDGRYMAIHRQPRTQVGAPVITHKKLPDGTTQDIQTSHVAFGNAMEVFDLGSGRASYLKLDDSIANMGGGQIVFGPQNRMLYLITFQKRVRDSMMQFADSITRIAFDGANLAVEDRATDGEGDHVIPQAGLPSPSPAAVVGGGQVLVRFWYEDYLQWIHLARLTVIREHHLGRDRVSAKPLPASVLFSSDGSRIYIANPLTGFIRVVDAVSGEMLAQTELPRLSTDQRPVLRYPGHPAAALSADGKVLYVNDVRTDPGGIWMLNLPDLSGRGFWTPDRPLSSLWLGADAVFAIGTDRNLYGRRTDGSTFSYAIQGLAAVGNFL